MKQYYIGELIKKRRKELHLTQEKLAEGICEPVTISRIENGYQTPSHHRLLALLQRLDLPEDKCYMLVSKNEMEISNLQTEIISANVLKDSMRGLEKIQELEEIAEPDDTLIQQFILRSKVLLGKLDNGQIVPYSFDEKLKMLFDAIRMTSPNFDVESIYEGLYSLDEVKVINQIALAYSDAGQHKKAIDIYYQLLKYIKKHFQNILQSNGLLSLVAFNYARELDLVGRYAEAVEIAESGWQACVQYGQYYYLPSTIALIAECYHFLNQDEKSKKYYKQAFYLFEAINNKRGAEIIKSEIQEYFGDTFVF